MVEALVTFKKKRRVRVLINYSPFKIKICFPIGSDRLCFTKCVCKLLRVCVVEYVWRVPAVMIGRHLCLSYRFLLDSFLRCQHHIYSCVCVSVRLCVRVCLHILRRIMQIGGGRRKKKRRDEKMDRLNQPSETSSLYINSWGIKCSA